MKILIITWGKLPLPSVLGGAVETLIDLFIKNNENKNRHDITIYSTANEKAKNESLKYNNCRFVYIDSNKLCFKLSRLIRGCINKLPKFYIANAFLYSVIKDLKKERIYNSYDAVIIENYPNYVIPLSKLFENKLILHLHNDFLHRNSKCSVKVFDKCNRIFTISEFIRRRVKTISNEDKVFTLHNGIDTDMFLNPLTLIEREEKRKSFGIEKDDIVFLFSGRLVPEKGIKELVEVFTEIYDEHKNIKLIIVGANFFGKNTTTLYIKELRNKMKKYKSKIIFTGFTEYIKMPEIYAIADIGVVPSQWQEPFCLALVEELSAGLPVIVSNSGGIPEIVNEKCSISVDLGKEFKSDLKTAMKLLIEKDDLRKKMGKEAVLQANKFNVQKYVEKFNLLLDEMGK